MNRLAVSGWAAMMVLAGAQAHAQSYCPSGEGGGASYQAAVECQRQNLAVRRQQAADQQARQQAYMAQQQAMQEAALGQQRRQQAEASRQSQARAEARQQAIRSAAYAQQQAEQSPDNHCVEQDVARAMLNSINSMMRKRVRFFEVIDAEHLTTTAFDPSRSVLACHGIFVQTNGIRVSGSYSTRLNVAGEPIARFNAD